MTTDSPSTFRRSIAQIIREDELPPDVLDRIRDALQQHRNADELYHWTMQLAPYLKTRDVKQIGKLLQHALKVLNGRPPDQNFAATLSKNTRDTLYKLRRNDDDVAGPATYVLGFDLITRAYNRSGASRAPA